MKKQKGNYKGFPGNHRPNMKRIHEIRKELLELDEEYFKRRHELQAEIPKIYEQEKVIRDVHQSMNVNLPLQAFLYIVLEIYP